MEVRENNIGDQFTKLFSTPYAKLGTFSIQIKNNDLWSMHGMVHPSARPSAEIELVFYIDQMSTQESIHYNLEKHLSHYLTRSNAAFVGRTSQVEIHKGITLTYKLKAFDFYEFADYIQKTYDEQIDREFTQALEAKLSED